VNVWLTSPDNPEIVPHPKRPATTMRATRRENPAKSVLLIVCLPMRGFAVARGFDVIVSRS
jgi:hypothetical protein